MPLDQVANFVRGGTGASVDSTQTTISVIDATVFPDPASGEYNLVLWDDNTYPRPDQDPDVEIVRVTARDTTNNNLTVSRAQEGTAGASHPSGSALQLSPTAAQFGNIAPTDQPVEDFSTNGADGTVPTSQGDGTITMEAPGGVSSYVNIADKALLFTNSLDISSQDDFSEGMAWNDDGLKLFIVGRGGDNIYEYGLSTAYDISTASFSQSFSVGSETVASRGIAWNDDGSKIYVISSDDNIYEYTVSTAFDISTASFSQSFSVASQDDFASGIAWNNSGTKVYITGTENASIYEYDVSTAYDISTASFSQSFSVASQDSSPTSVLWNDTGGKVYISGGSSAAIYSYNCSIEFDISTASFSTSFDVSDKAGSPVSTVWNNNGSKLYFLAQDTDRAYSYRRLTTLDY